MPYYRTELVEITYMLKKFTFTILIKFIENKFFIVSNDNGWWVFQRLMTEYNVKYEEINLFCLGHKFLYNAHKVEALMR